MTRKSTHADERLLLAARELLDESGFTGLKIRQVAARAKVNLGMFHYHFKTKDEFVRRVLQDTYERFFQEFSLESGQEGSSLEKLRRTLTMLANFSRDNRLFVMAILQDVMNRNPAAIKFAKTNFPRHGIVVAGLVKKCQDDGCLDRRPFTVVLPFLIGSLAMPIMMVGIAERAEAKAFLGLAVKVFQHHLLSDDAIQQRVEMALKGLGAREGTPA
jgi:AcrR family transcriptional regulator